jgi:hypothetical protein
MSYGCFGHCSSTRFPVPNCQPDPWPVLHGLRENVFRLFEVIAGVQHAVDFAAVLGPLLDLVVIAVVRQEGIVGLFVGPIGHCGVGSFDLVRGDYLPGAPRKPPHGSTLLLASGSRFIRAL